MSKLSENPRPQHRQKLPTLYSGPAEPTTAARLELSECIDRESRRTETNLHVNPVGENWEVESETGTLGQAETKQQAEELAHVLAHDLGAAKVTVHTADGQVEKEIPISSPDSPRS